MEIKKHRYLINLCLWNGFCKNFNKMLCSFEKKAYLCNINLRVIHNKDYSVVNIKESQNYFLIVEVLFLCISVKLRRCYLRIVVYFELMSRKLPFFYHSLGVFAKFYYLCKNA